MKKKTTIFIVIMILIVIIAVGAVIYAILKKDNKEDIIFEKEVLEPETEVAKEEKKIQIYQGDSRPIAVMIDNHKAALPQAGLNSAYMVYEIIVEGGESRLMALFKNENVDVVGPIRSARHYFLDYALENDAIYAHFGWSPQAESDISSLGVNNINGLYYDGTSSYWRVKDKSAPHNVKASLSALRKLAESKGYRTTSEVSSVLKYVTDEVELEDGQSAIEITIPYSDSNIVKYEYDTESQRYQRYSKGVKEKDWDTEEAITTKNIIITFAKNTTLYDGENKDRQNLSNIGTLDGYYITNGKAIKITCEKTARSSRTVYKDLDGNEIKVNDGNTYVQICPINAKVVIEGNEEIVGNNEVQ